MPGESLNDNEPNTGSDWDKVMADVPQSNGIDLEKRKQEIESLKLDIEKERLETELKLLKREKSAASLGMDSESKKQDREERTADARARAEEGAYRDIEHIHPDHIADTYRTQAFLDDENYSDYQDAAKKHIENTLGGADQKLDIIDKHKEKI